MVWTGERFRSYNENGVPSEGPSTGVLHFSASNCTGTMFIRPQNLSSGGNFSPFDLPTHVNISGFAFWEVELDVTQSLTTQSLRNSDNCINTSTTDSYYPFTLVEEVTAVATPLTVAPKP